MLWDTSRCLPGGARAGPHPHTRLTEPCVYGVTGTMNLSSNREAAQPGWGPPLAASAQSGLGDLAAPSSQMRRPRLGLVRWLPRGHRLVRTGAHPAWGPLHASHPRGAPGSSCRALQGPQHRLMGSGGARHCRHPQNSNEAQSQTLLPRVGGWLSHTECPPRG